MEFNFLLKAADLLVDGGLMALVCPEDVAGRWDVGRLLGERFTNLSAMEFPDGHRKYKEVVVFGTKDENATKPFFLLDVLKAAEQEPDFEDEVYLLPSACGPRRFEKSGFTPDELADAMSGSPLRRLLEEPKPVPLPRPPLPLATGHIALLLAAGHLDGVVRPEGEKPHVVRGSAKKETYLVSVEDSEDSQGREVTKKVFGEKIVMTVRTATSDGVIHTFDQE